MKIRIALATLLIGSLLSGDCIDDATQQDSLQACPDLYSYGTHYANCRINKDYPYETEEQEISISGIVRSGITLPKIHPLINSVFIDDILLYSPATGEMLTFYGEFRSPVGKEIELAGYYGNIISVDVMGRHKEYQTFYVTNIPEWYSVCYDATLEDTGIVTTPNVCFWRKK